MKQTFIILLLFIFLAPKLKAGNQDSLNYSSTKKYKVLYYSAFGGVYLSTMTGLYQLWYRDYEHSGFHWFNDQNEWLQMDKVGHVYGTYQLTSYLYWGLRFAKPHSQNNLIECSLSAWLAFSGIEILDGISEGWGASLSDLTANTTGALLFVTQQKIWNEQRISPKFSYSPSKYPEYRHDQLGYSWTERAMKDYNGQTYWLSFNVKSFGVPKVPTWFNLAVGYGADGMLGGKNNPSISQGNTLPDFERNRQVYLSFDIDWTRVKTKNKTLRFILRGLNLLKFPAPAIEFSGGSIKGYWIYF